MPSRLNASHSDSITSLFTLSIPSGSAIQKVSENFIPTSANSVRMQFGGLLLMARGAAAAINTGVRAARFPIICQVDQDVVLRPGWMRMLAEELDDPKVAAVQGYYATDPGATLCARAMSLDLEQRYAAIDSDDTEHACTGNSAYRAEALRTVGLLDETFGYGYDNDLSYRLREAGYRLTFCRRAQSVHRWREGLIGYLAQQYGFGYGRIDLVAKHPGRVWRARRWRLRPMAPGAPWLSARRRCSRVLRSNDWRPASARRGASAM